MVGDREGFQDASRAYAKGELGGNGRRLVDSSATYGSDPGDVHFHICPLPEPFGGEHIHLKGRAPEKEKINGGVTSVRVAYRLGEEVHCGVHRLIETSPEEREGGSVARVAEKLKLEEGCGGGINGIFPGDGKGAVPHRILSPYLHPVGSILKKKDFAVRLGIEGRGRIVDGIEPGEDERLRIVDKDLDRDRRPVASRRRIEVNQGRGLIHKVKVLLPSGTTRVLDGKAVVALPEGDGRGVGPVEGWGRDRNPLSRKGGGCISKGEAGEIEADGGPGRGDRDGDRFVVKPRLRRKEEGTLPWGARGFPTSRKGGNDEEEPPEREEIPGQSHRIL
jgi:hypothetical protein